MRDAILTLNAGSSSIKFAVFEATGPLARILSGAVENIGAAPHFSMYDTAGKPIHEARWAQGGSLVHEDLLAPLLDRIDAHLGGAKIIAAGHRIVHGGADFTAPVRLDAATLATLAKLNVLAPLHEPHNLAAVTALMALRPDLPQIGCFDTAFHHTMPALATRLPLPRALQAEGIRRYGFHGLSYEYIAGAFAALAPGRAAGRVIALHLGNGASACAMQNGKSLDSSMGFTALDGLIMGTRSGALDPGVILYLMQTHGMSAQDITELLYKKSGLLGMSGLSSDVRVLLASDSPAAAQALASFAFAAARQAAALLPSLGGLDALIFTAGIGEHAPPIRAAICTHLAWLGIELDVQANTVNAPCISTKASTIAVHVIPTDEEKMIAEHCRAVLG